MKQIRKLADLTPDRRNANRGTERGNAMLGRSIEEFGVRRSIVVDRNGVVLAGNKTLEAAAAAGIERVQVVTGDGRTITVVQCPDIEADSAKGRRLAVADNRTGETNLDWDCPVLLGMHQEFGLEGFFSEAELSKEFEAEDEADGDVCPTCGRKLGKRRP